MSVQTLVKSTLLSNGKKKQTHRVILIDRQSHTQIPAKVMDFMLNQSKNNFKHLFNIKLITFGVWAVLRATKRRLSAYEIF